jgi:lysophospholipase L1-like esterase
MAKQSSGTKPVSKVSGNPKSVRSLFSVKRGLDGNLVAVTKNDVPAQFETASGILDIHRPFKNRRYREKRNDPSYRGPIIVAEGDSWFEFPLTKDIIMWLGETYAILSLAKAGDAWADVQDQNELIPAVKSEKPDIVLISMGGNEVMGNIDKYVHSFDANLGRDDYIRPNFPPLLDGIQRQYEVTITEILNKRPQAKVILHGYDYPNPREWQQGGQWIGGPMENFLRIGDHTQWRHTANAMIDMFNDHQRATAAKFPDSVFYVNLRRTIGRDDDEWLGPEDEWDDEIHGTDDGFERLAQKLADKIDEITPRRTPQPLTELSARARMRGKAKPKKKRR